MRARPADPSCSPVCAPAAGSRSTAGSVFLIGADPARPGQLPWPAAAALAAADAVLHDDGIDPTILALIPHRCFVEPVPAENARGSAENAAIGRARKLAGEGWRVVWLVAGDPERAPAEFAKAAGLAATGITIRTCALLTERGPEAAYAEMCGPQHLATALNGLAG